MVWILLFIVMAAVVLGYVVNEFGKGADRAMASSTSDLEPADAGAVARAESIPALKERGDAGAVAKLESLAQDSDRTVRSLARSALDDLRAAR